MKLARPFLVVPAALLALAATACGGSDTPKRVPPDAVAIVGDTPITKTDFARMLAANKVSYKLRGQDIPPADSEAYRTLSNKVLNILVEDAEFSARAKSDLGVEVDKDEVDRRLNDYKHQFTGDSEARFEKELEQQGTTVEQVRARLHAQLLSDAIFKKVSARATVSDDDIEAYYKSHLTGYKHPATRQVRHILVKTKAEADKVERLLKNGGDFTALAKKYSIDTSTSPLGGRLPGGITTGQTLPAFDKIAFSLKKDEISAPVQTQYGWHVIQATSAVKPEQTTPLGQVSSAIKTQLLQQARQNAMTRWITETKAEFAKKTLYAAGYGPVAAVPNEVGEGG